MRKIVGNGHLSFGITDVIIFKNGSATVVLLKLSRLDKIFWILVPGVKLVLTSEVARVQTVTWKNLNSYCQTTIFVKVAKSTFLLSIKKIKFYNSMASNTVR